MFRSLQDLEIQFVFKSFFFVGVPIYIRSLVSCGVGIVSGKQRVVSVQHMVALLDCHLPEGEQQEGLSRKKTQTKAKTKTKKIIWLLCWTATLPPTRGGAARGTFQLSRKKIETNAKTKTNKKKNKN